MTSEFDSKSNASPSDANANEIKTKQDEDVGGLTKLDPVQIEKELQSSRQIGEKLDGLSDLLMDNNVKAIIKMVAGQETHSIIENAVQSIQQSSSMENKHRVLTTATQKIQSTLKKSDLPANKGGPAIDLVLNLLKARGDKI